MDLGKYKIIFLSLDAPFHFKQTLLIHFLCADSTLHKSTSKKNLAQNEKVY
jgi:hypothetical protein